MPLLPDDRELLERFRRGDRRAMAAVFNACKDLEGFDTHQRRAEDYAQRFAHLSDFDPHQDLLFAEKNGKTEGTRSSDGILSTGSRSS